MLLAVERVALLRHVDLFAKAPGRVLAGLARVLEEVDFPTGAELMHEGAVEDWLFVVVEGEVEVVRSDRLVRLGAGSVVVGWPFWTHNRAPRPSPRHPRSSPSACARRPSTRRSAPAPRSPPGSSPSWSTGCASRTNPAAPVRERLLLLGGQTVALGVMMAFLVVPASALFLDEYGASALPYAYLAVAVAGAGTTYAMTRAQRRLSLSSLAAAVLAVYVVVVVGAWVVLTVSDGTWVTFPLLVLFPLSIPIGFALVGAQAGRLLDVREMKANFPRVAAGFSSASPSGDWRRLRSWSARRSAEPPRRRRRRRARDGGARPRDVVALPEPAHAPRAALGGAAAAAGGRPRPLGLLRHRLVLLIFGYQALSAAVTQLLDFMAWERAAARYPDPSDLARFQGVFGAVINIVSVAFVFAVAGWLLTRFGIGVGLLANPVGVLVLLLVTAVTGWSAGVGSLVFFLFVCAQQVADIALTDGTTRTSINATYQALLPEQRLQAQTLVEGAGVPIALGVVGAAPPQGRPRPGYRVGHRRGAPAQSRLGPGGRARLPGVRRQPALGPRPAGVDATSLRVDDRHPGMPWRTSSRALTRATSAPVWRRSPTPTAPSCRARSARCSRRSRRGGGSSVSRRWGRSTSTVAGLVDVAQRLLGDEDPELRLLAAGALVDRPGAVGERARETWRAGAADAGTLVVALEAAAAAPSPFFADAARDARRPRGCTGRAARRHGRQRGPPRAGGGDRARRPGRGAGRQGPPRPRPR